MLAMRVHFKLVHRTVRRSDALLLQIDLQLETGAGFRRLE